MRLLPHYVSGVIVLLVAGDASARTEVLKTQAGSVVSLVDRKLNVEEILDTIEQRAVGGAPQNVRRFRGDHRPSWPSGR